MGISRFEPEDCDNFTPSNHSNLSHSSILRRPSAHRHLPSLLLLQLPSSLPAAESPGDDQGFYEKLPSGISFVDLGLASYKTPRDQQSRVMNRPFHLSVPQSLIAEENNRVICIFTSRRAVMFTSHEMTNNSCLPAAICFRPSDFFSLIPFST